MSDQSRASVTAVHGSKHAAYPFEAGHCGQCDEVAEHRPAYVEVSLTERFVVKVADRSDLGIGPKPPYEMSDVGEELDRWRDLMGPEPHAHTYGELDVEVHDESPDSGSWYHPEVLDHDGQPQMLWRARRELGEAARTLVRARYREGHCPELDQITRDIRALEERLRIAATEVDEHRANGGTGVIHTREPAAELTGPKEEGSDADS